MTLAPAVKRALFGVIAALLAVVAYLTLTMPPVLQLGTLVRLVIFHGASTWVNMGLFTLAGVTALAFLATRSDALYSWASAFRYLAVPLWVVNTGLGMVSSRLAWNSVNLAEPRLQASFWIMLAAGLVLAVDFGLGRKRLTALADVLMAGALWALILGARNFVHPDNPVMNSGPEIQLPFFGIVGAYAVGMLLAAALIATSRSAEEVAVPGD